MRDPKWIKLFDDLIIDARGAVILRKHNTGILSDLHIGMEESSLALTRMQTKHMLNKIKGIINDHSIKTLILNGDIKHGFGKEIKQEWDEIKLLLNKIKEMGVSPVVIKGNHDNYIETIIGKSVDEYIEINDIFITHGHKLFKTDKLQIIGNEHPIIKIKDSVGATQRYPVFMVFKDVNVVVTPAFNPLSRGSNILELMPNQLMSPVLKNASIEKAHIYACIDESVIIDMATVFELKRAINEEIL